MENSKCHMCGINNFVGNKYAAYHELSKYELMCECCQKQADEQREKIESKNRKICRWWFHRWGEERLHPIGLVQYCQRPGCKAEKIHDCRGGPWS